MGVHERMCTGALGVCQEEPRPLAGGGPRATCCNLCQRYEVSSQHSGCSGTIAQVHASAEPAALLLWSQRVALRLWSGGACVQCYQDEDADARTLRYSRPK